jgi:HD superfamily phosphohydrolase
VANQNNSLDVDKIDYICRDVYHLGISSSTINYNSLINGTKIIDDSLCYNVENTFEINFIYSSRYNLFKKVYTHKVVQAIDLMLRDCLIQADPVYKFLEKVNDVEEYLKLNDYILVDIEKSNDKVNR